MSGHKTASGHLNPAAVPRPKPCPGAAVPREPQPRGLSAASAPSAALRCPRRLWGGFPGWAELSGGSWEGSQGIWGGLRVLGRFQDKGMSLRCPSPANGTSSRAVGTPRTPEVGAGDHSLCHSMPARASGPLSLLSMLSPPTIRLFPQTPCSRPIKAPFCSTNTHLGPQEGWGVLFSPPLGVSAEGQGCSSMGFLSGGLRAGFAPQIAGAGGGRCPGQGITSLLPHRVGKRHQPATRGAQGPSWPEPEGRETVWLFSCIFQMFLQHTEQPEKVRDERLRGVNTEGWGLVLPTPPSSLGCSQLCPPALP